MITKELGNIWLTSDGTKFFTQDDAIKHENKKEIAWIKRLKGLSPKLKQ